MRGESIMIWIIGVSKLIRNLSLIQLEGRGSEVATAGAERLEAFGGTLYYACDLHGMANMDTMYCRYVRVNTLRENF